MAEPTRWAVCSMPPPEPARRGSTSARVRVTFGRDHQPATEAGEQQGGRQFQPDHAAQVRHQQVDDHQTGGHQHQPDHHERAAEPRHQTAAEGRRDRRPDGERRLGRAGLQRAVVQSDLQVERGDQEDRGESGEVEGAEGEAEHVRADLQQGEVDQRLPAEPVPAPLPEIEDHQQRERRRQQPPGPLPTTTRSACLRRVGTRSTTRWPRTGRRRPDRATAGAVHPRGAAGFSAPAESARHRSAR